MRIHSLKDWYKENLEQFENAEREQKHASKILAKSDRITEEAQHVVSRNLETTDHQFDVKLNDIEYLRELLETTKQSSDEEVEALKAYRDRVHDASSNLEENALTLCRKCISLRRNRIGVDLCHDEVENELLVECKMIEGVILLLKELFSQLTEQGRKLRSCTYFISRDLENKMSGLVIDRHNACLKPTSLHLESSQNPITLKLESSTMEEWNLYTHNNITKTRKEIEKSRPLRSYVDTILRKSVDDLNFQFDKCNRAFHQRIDEYKEAKSKLENQHFETLRQANEMIRNIDRLEKAISDKEAYMALARTRFNNRVHRPGIELCRDDVEIQLITEIKEIESSVANLHSVLNEAQKSLQHLQKAQIQLEGEINVKTNSLKIDEVDCMSTRAAMNYHFY